MTALVDRIADLLDGDEPDRQRRAWSIVALMVGSILIPRGTGGHRWPAGLATGGEGKPAGEAGGDEGSPVQIGPLQR